MRNMGLPYHHAHEDLVNLRYYPVSFGTLAPRIDRLTTHSAQVRTADAARHD
jgi:hypothetical protein